MSRKQPRLTRREKREKQYDVGAIVRQVVAKSRAHIFAEIERRRAEGDMVAVYTNLKADPSAPEKGMGELLVEPRAWAQAWAADRKLSRVATALLRPAREGTIWGVFVGTNGAYAEEIPLDETDRPAGDA